MDQELPKGFVVTEREDGRIAVTYKVFPGILKDLLFSGGAAAAGALLLRVDLRFSLICFAFAVAGLVVLWMNSMRKLEFFPGDGTFTYRCGPVGGKVSADDIATLDAKQLGQNAGSYALIAESREGKAHNLFRYLNEEDAGALLNWTIRKIESSAHDNR